MSPSLILFASGKGSNARAIIEYFNSNQKAKVSLIVSNNPTAGVLDIAKEFDIPTLVLPSKEMNTDNFIEILHSHHPSLILLAGYLKKIPSKMVAEFSESIINMHPALLPKYGGKGMYGIHVHNAVIAAQESQSGMTIHYVNERYDEGNIILQSYCKIQATDTPDSLAAKVLRLEHFYFPRTIEFLLEHTDGY